MNQATLYNSAEINGTLFDSRHLVWAITLSVLLHLLLLQLMPLLEQYHPKPINTIMAELRSQPPSTQPAIATPQPTPAETPAPQPEVKQPQPIKTKPDPQPILQSKSEAQPDDYVVPETKLNPKLEPTPTQNLSTPQPTTEPTATTAVTANPISNTSTTTHTNTSTNSKPDATPTSADDWDDSAYDAYGRNLQRLCERNKKYPAIAIRRGWQGSGSVVVRFSAEGKLLSMTIEQSTGQKALDDQALEMVRKSLADLPLPSQMKGREFKISVPVDFKLE
ncbi:MAG: TonB family protein [Methylotenera sp.]|nr:TonB family protein [Methylotenera sp.]